MSRYGSFNSIQYVELMAGDEAVETEFNFTLICTSTGRDAKLFGEPGDCYPAESAEFELESIQVYDEYGKPVEVSEDILTAIIGKAAFENMLNRSIIDADESGEF